MKPNQPATSRKRFLIGAAALLSSLSLLKIIPGRKQKEKETVRMLTRDGQLVEIDRSLVSMNAKKATDEQLKNWIRK